MVANNPLIKSSGTARSTIFGSDDRVMRWADKVSVVVAFLAALPLMVVHPAFLQDWPNHIARSEIVVSLLRGNPFWRPFYTVNGPFVPNMASDVGMVVPELLGVPPDIASSLFLVFTYGLLISGGAALARAFGAYDRTTLLLLVLLFYTGTLFYGLVNYIVGIGSMLWVLAFWHRARSRTQYAVICVGVAFVFFAHLIAATLLVLLILVQEASVIWHTPKRDWPVLKQHATGVAGLLVLGVLAALSTVGHGGSEGGILYTNGPSIFAVLVAKVVRVVHTLVDGGGMIGAILLLVGLAVWIAAISCDGCIMPRDGAVFLLVPFLLFLAMPAKIGEADTLDYRMVLVGLLLAATMMRVAWKSQARAVFVWGMLLLTVIGRTAVVTAALVQRSHTLADFDRLIQTIPPDSMLLTGVGEEHVPWLQYWNPPLIMLASRAARVGVFVPSVFALESQHTLVLRPHYRALAQWELTDTETHLVEAHRRLKQVCTDWNRTHSGAVLMLVVYPSVEIDHALSSDRVLAAGNRFRLVDACELGTSYTKSLRG